MPSPVRSRSFKRGGYIPDLPDHRDMRYGAVRHVDVTALPPSVDLEPLCPPVVDQGDLSSCTANALCSAVSFLDIKEHITPTEPLSRLFVYYNERRIEDTIAQDGGAMIRDGIKSLAAQGVCSEDSWPYDPIALTDRPTQACYDQAIIHQIGCYARLDTLDEMKHCLAEGFPFVFGFSVFESMMSDEVAATGLVPMPATNDAMVGGHAVKGVGYDDIVRKAVKAKNSWASSWGLNGYFWLPYEYFTSGLVSDAWSIRRESNF